MATGDLRNNCEKLRAELKRLRFDGVLDTAAVVRGDAPTFLRVLHFVLLVASPALARELLRAGHALAGKSDLKFLEAVYKLCRDEFAYRPRLSRDQFFSDGFAEQKILFVCDVIQHAMAGMAKLEPPAPRLQRTPHADPIPVQAAEFWNDSALPPAPADARAAAPAPASPGEAPRARAAAPASPPANPAAADESDADDDLLISRDRLVRAAAQQQQQQQPHSTVVGAGASAALAQILQATAALSERVATAVTRIDALDTKVAALSANLAARLSLAEGRLTLLEDASRAPSVAAAPASSAAPTSSPPRRRELFALSDAPASSPGHAPASAAHVRAAPVRTAVAVDSESTSAFAASFASRLEETQRLLDAVRSGK